MANIYVYSGAAGAGTGADWANAYLTLKAAAEAAGTAAGDSIWVANDHAETGAIALVITSKNTLTAPGTIACVDRGGSVPPVAADLRTTGTVTTTGASAIQLTGGSTYYYGLSFSAGSGAVSSGITIGGNSTFSYTFEACKLIKPGTTAGVAFVFGTFNSSIRRIIRLVNTSLTYGNVADTSNSSFTTFEWRDTATPIVGAIIPAFLFSGIDPAVHYFDNLDLSAMTSVTATGLFNTGVNLPGYYVVSRCKLGSGIVITAAPIAPGGGVDVVNCDSGATNYRSERYRYQATQTTETVIVRTGGATDGTTPISWKVVTTANSKLTFPFECLPITVWSDTTGAKTVSIYGYWNNAAVPNNNDIWIEVDYLGSALTPIGSTATSGLASFLAVATSIPSDTSTWGGGVTTSKFKMSATLTTAMKGPITVRVKAAKASNTFYIDPKIEIV